MRYYILLFFITFYSCNSNSKGDEVKIFEHSVQNEKTIHDIIKLYNKDLFKKDRDLKVYKSFNNNRVWLHYDSKGQASYYVTLSNTYIKYSKLYVENNNEVKELDEINSINKFPFQSIFYRHPVWQLPNDFEKGNIFILLENDSDRVRLDVKIEEQNSFLKRIQTEYFLFSAYIVFLFVVSLILLYFSISRKKYSILFYIGYIYCMIIEFLAGEGIGVQFLWSKSTFLVNSSRTFSQTIAVLMIALFFYSFYSYKKQNFINKNIFKYCAIIVSLFLSVYLYKIIDPHFFSSFYIYNWIAMKLVIVIFMINHLNLAKQKLIPSYLLFGFFLPPIAMLLYQYINPSQNTSSLVLNFLYYFHYLSIIVEVIIFSVYIFKTIIKDQENYDSLLKSNEVLVVNFDKIVKESLVKERKDLMNSFKSQEKERERILSEVHEALGGYIQALKMGFEKYDDSKIDEILKAFHVEYRHTIQNLYSPRINTVNFADTLDQYAKRLNDIRDIKIQCDFKIKDSEIDLPEVTCLHLYRSYSELITNAIKHSSANNIYVSFWQNDEKDFLLQVKDDGVGFNITESKWDSFGIRNVKKRIDEIKGDVDIKSSSKGTDVILKIPYGETN